MDTLIRKAASAPNMQPTPHPDARTENAITLIDDDGDDFSFDTKLECIQWMASLLHMKVME